MRKWKIYTAWQFEKEEAWLNEMARQGYILKDVALFMYDFDYVGDNDTIIRLEAFKGTDDVSEKISFYEGCGFKHVGSILRWHYFSGDSSQLTTEKLLTDNESKIEMLESYKKMMWILMIFNGFNFLNLTLNLRISGRITFIILLIVGVLGYAIYRMSRQIEDLKDMEL